MPKPIGVIIVDDSAFMRKVITDILESAGDIRVLGTAKDGNEALQKVKDLHPDVITLDVEMPNMDGLTCLKELQKITKASVIMLSSLTKSGGKSTIEALEAGAIDFITKPQGLFDIAGNEKKQEIIDKIRMAKRVKRSKAIDKAIDKHRLKSIDDKNLIKSSTLKTIVAIGTSTGGPKALQEVLPFIPANVPAALLIVQHMPAGFTKSLAERLNSLSCLSVKEAEDGDIIEPGFAYIAPGDYHLTVKNKDGNISIVLNQDPQVGGHRPAVNVMMNSLSETGFNSIIGVIMTGMGSDGSEGIKNIKKKNKGIIISQDEKSCVVYGMPRAAALTGAVDIVAPLKGIADEIIRNLGV